jgi:hypothetical protein
MKKSKNMGNATFLEKAKLSEKDLDKIQGGAAWTGDPLRFGDGQFTRRDVLTTRLS